jgi:multidrug transporter EmrE-like cation transporter
MNWNAWNFVFAAAVNNCLAGLLLKRSSLDNADAGLLALLFSPFFLGAMACYSVNVLLFAKALDRLPVSIAYPVLAGMGFGLIAIASNWFFGERLGFNQLVGIGLILAGIIVASR